MSHAAAPRNHLVRWAAVTVTIIVALWGVAGWAIDKGPTPEGLLLVALTVSLACLTLNASAQMRRSTLDRTRSFWRRTLLISAAWTAYSAHHAYDIFVGMPEMVLTPAGVLGALHSASALIVLTALVFIEPFVPGAIEDTEHEAVEALRERDAEADAARRRREAEAEAWRLRREAASREAEAERAAPRETAPHGMTRRLAVAASGLSLIASPAAASQAHETEPQGRASTLEATRPKPYDASIVQGWLEARSDNPTLTQVAYVETAGISRATLQRHLKRWSDAGEPRLAG